MKRLNKKGFTLIELLAVIIILGILMIIAIPSVTSYIQNSRKSAYVDTAVNYADSVMKEVNSGKNLKLYSTDTLYMIAVGNDKDSSCVTVESGGQSPFGDKWRYAYVGVTYDGKGYSYYLIAEDSAGQGIPFVTKKELTDDGTDFLYSKYGTLNHTDKGTETMTSDFATTLENIYTGHQNKTLSGNEITSEYKVVLTDYITGAEADSSANPPVSEIAGKEPGKTINKVQFIVGSNGVCNYTTETQGANGTSNP